MWQAAAGDVNTYDPALGSRPCIGLSTYLALLQFDYDHFLHFEYVLLFDVTRTTFW